MCNELPDFEIQADAEADYLAYQREEEREAEMEEDAREAYKAAMEGFEQPEYTDQELDDMWLEYGAFEHQDDIPEGW